LPFLKKQREILEIYVFSKLWNLPRFFLSLRLWLSRPLVLLALFSGWAHLERLAWQELHHRREVGGWECPASSPGARPSSPSSCATRWWQVAPCPPIWLFGLGWRLITLFPALLWMPVCQTPLFPLSLLGMSWWRFSHMARSPLLAWHGLCLLAYTPSSWIAPLQSGGQVALCLG
jgi:hypothetical protein